MNRISQGVLIAIVLSVTACDSLPLGGRKPAASKAPPIKAAPKGINLTGNCSQREVDGFEEQAKVTVRSGRVRQLTWRMKIGRKGSCSFNGDGFRQTKTTPSIELTANDGSGCKLLMWSDPRRITLAHSGCAKYCTPRGVYDKAWPVMFDPRTGGCAKTR